MDKSITHTLSDLLALDQPPVALAFATEPPAGVATAAAAPSSCSFWRLAEQGVFYAPADHHFHCQVGAMVMGFDLPDVVNQELAGVVEAMCGNGYLTIDEASRIPTVKTASAGILYGPLVDFPTAPDLVLLWLTPGQAMLCNEAAGSARWTGQPMSVHGRPGCAALALAHESGRPQVSLGCAGMRFFTGLSEDRSLFVLPGARVAELAESLQEVTEANRLMRDHYRDRRAAFSEPPR